MERCVGGEVSIKMGTEKQCEIDRQAFRLTYSKTKLDVVAERIHVLGFRRVVSRFPYINQMKWEGRMVGGADRPASAGSATVGLVHIDA
jgi:hypothetical protein